MPFQVTKTYGHERGFSCTFRQWRAEHSHCRFLHGYSLSFTFVFEADKLDGRNWVIDFGNMNSLEKDLRSHFDHTTAVATDDPNWDEFQRMNKFEIIQMVHFTAVGCEAFARVGFMMAQRLLDTNNLSGRVRVVSCTVAEHGANSATYKE